MSNKEKKLKLAGTKRQKICIAIQLILVVSALLLNLAENIWKLEYAMISTISNIFLFLVIFILPLSIVTGEDEKKK